MRRTSKIDRILAKYPCDKNGILTVGIDLLRHDLMKAFGVKAFEAGNTKTKKAKKGAQCCFEKPDGEGGVLFCWLNTGHTGRHEFFIERSTLRGV